MRKHMVLHGEHEGISVGSWLPGRLASDLTEVGVGNTHIVIKTDTEPAIVDLRNDIVNTASDVPTVFDDYQCEIPTATAPSKGQSGMRRD